MWCSSVLPTTSGCVGQADEGLHALYSRLVPPFLTAATNPRKLGLRWAMTAASKPAAMSRAFAFNALIPDRSNDLLDNVDDDGPMPWWNTDILHRHTLGSDVRQQEGQRSSFRLSRCDDHNALGHVSCRSPEFGSTRLARSPMHPAPAEWPPRRPPRRSFPVPGLDAPRARRLDRPTHPTPAASAW